MRVAAGWPVVFVALTVAVPVPRSEAQCPDGSVPPCATSVNAQANARIAAEAAARRRAVAVLYFESTDRRLASVADGLTEDLIVALQSAHGLQVLSRAGSMSVRSVDAPHDSLARVLGVGTLVTGVVSAAGDSIRVTYRLLDDAGIEMDRGSFARGNRDVVEASAQLAERVASLVRKRIGDAIQFSRMRSGTRNNEAWLRYQRAVQLRDRGDSVYTSRSAHWGSIYHEADSVAAVAERLDPRWSEPSILRGWMAYWRARRNPVDTVVHRVLGDSALLFAARALAREPVSAKTLALRGEVRYWRWLFRLDSDTVVRRRLLNDAKADLESAVRRDPSLAGAYATLSHMYNNVPGKTQTDVRVTAALALERDAFLANADVIMSRLALAAFDDSAHAEADRWCREGARRFPTNARFYRCQLFNMGMPEARADTARARVLVDSLELLTLESDRPALREYTHALMGIVLARAGATDSARVLLARATANSELVPIVAGSIDLFTAYGWILVGDHDQAIAAIKREIVRRPGLSGEPGNRWMFNPLKRDPRYASLRYGLPQNP